MAGIIFTTFQRPSSRATRKDCQKSGRLQEFDVIPKPDKLGDIRAIPAIEAVKNSARGRIILEKNDENQRRNDEEIDLPMMLDVLPANLLGVISRVLPEALDSSASTDLRTLSKRLSRVLVKGLLLQGLGIREDRALGQQRLVAAQLAGDDDVAILDPIGLGFVASP